MKYKVEINGLGEIRMGAEAFGLKVITETGEFNSLWDEPVLVGDDDYSKVIEKSNDGNALCINGQFATYILNLKENTISLYKVTVRGSNNEWSEETPIFGPDKTHISGFKKHYYIQFPFVKDIELHTYVSKYVQLRQTQIEEAVNAL